MNIIRQSIPGLLIAVLAASTAYAENAAPVAQDGSDSEIYFVPFSHLDLFWGGSARSVWPAATQLSPGRSGWPGNQPSSASCWKTMFLWPTI